MLSSSTTNKSQSDFQPNSVTAMSFKFLFSSSVSQLSVASFKASLGGPYKYLVFMVGPKFSLSADSTILLPSSS